MDVSERRNKAGFKPIREVVDEVYNHLYDLSNNKSDITGLSTGYDKLDK